MPEDIQGAFPHLWSLPHAEPHLARGSLLFADISGFTALSERLAREGTRGTETLTQLLNQYFQTMLGLSEHLGGTVLGLSGDALLVGFYGEPTHTHPWACHCAARMLQAMTPFHAYPTPWGPASVDMKTVVASGTWGETLLGDHRRRVPFFYGTLLQHLLQAEDRARQGELWVQGTRQDPTRFLDPPASPHPTPAATPLPPENRSGFLPQGVDQFLDRALSGEHRPASALFLFLEGFLPDHPPLRELQRFVLSLLDVLELHGGSLNKSDIAGAGWKLLLTFGAPITTEDAPIEAVKAALALADTGREQIRVRMGLATGFVYAGMVGSSRTREYTVIGDPVNTAARLAAAAPPEQVLMDPATRRLTLPRLESELYGTLQLQGKSEPLRCYRPQTTPGTPLPTLPFVGREDLHLQALEALAQPGVIRIRGQAGIGKTRFLKEVLEQVPRNRLMLQGTVDAQEDAYQIFRDWMDGLAHVRSQPDEEAQRAALNRHLQHLEDPTGGLKRRIPFLGAMLFHLPYPGSLHEKVSPRLRKENLLEGLRLYLRALTRQGPLLLVVDHAHLLQPTSLEFLNRLMGDLLSPVHAPPAPVTFVFAGRDFPERLNSLQIPEGASLRDLTLFPLSLTEVRELVKRTLRRPLTETQLAHLYRMTQGVPLYLEQILLQIRTGDRTLEDLLLPEVSYTESVWTTVMAQVDRLPPPTQKGLRIGSVVGPSFPAAIVAQLTQQNPQEVLFPAEQSGLIQRVSGTPQGYTFRHVTVQEVIYRSMLRKDRRRLHLRVAEAYQRLYPETFPQRDEILAHHYRKAEVWDRALHHLRQSAEHHAQQGQLQEAMERFVQALSLLETHRLGTNEDAFQLHLRCAQVTDMLGDARATAHHFQQAERFAGDHPAWRARVYRERAHTLQFQGDSEHALQEILQAQELLQQIPPPRPVFLEAEIQGTRCWIHTMRGEYTRAIQAGEAALNALDRDRERVEEDRITDWMGRRAMLLNFLGLARTWVHELTEAETLFLEAMELADIGGFPEILASVEGNLALLEQKRGQFEQAISRTRRHLAHFEQLGALREQARVSNNLGLLLLDRGQNVDEAERLFRQSLQISETHHFPLIQAQSISCLGMLDLARGAYREALHHFQHAAQAFQKLNLGYYVVANRLNAALCQMEEGHLGKAARALTDLSQAIQAYRHTGLYIEWLYHRTLLEIQRKNLPEAEHLLKEIRTRLEEHPEQYAAYIIPHVAGKIAAARSNWDEARRYFQTALGQLLQSEDVRVRGTLLLDLATACVHLGIPEGSRYLHEAEQLFAAYPHTPNLQRIQELRSSG